MKGNLHKLATGTAFALIVGASAAHAQSSSMDEDMKMAKQFMQTAQAFVQSAVGSDGNVSATVNGDTVTLVGFVDNTSIKAKAEKAALMDMRVEKVENLIISN